jgi:hypothetical protein
MLLKESVDDPRIIDRICNILIPREFTRLDEIVEIVFFTTEEAKQSPPFEEVIEDDSLETEPKAAARPAAFHEACIERFSRQHKVKLIRRSRASFSTSDGSFAVICAVSKAHHIRNQTSYWFAFHPYYKDFLEKSPNSFLVLGCGSGDYVLEIPYNELLSWLDDLWTTEMEDRMYWHIRLRFERNQFYLDRKKDRGRLNITRFLNPTEKKAR